MHCQTVHDNGRMMSQRGAASCSSPHGSEYQRGTMGGSLFHEIPIAIDWITIKSIESFMEIFITQFLFRYEI
jgi:hypothetical protein